MTDQEFRAWLKEMAASKGIEDEDSSLIEHVCASLTFEEIWEDLTIEDAEIVLWNIQAFLGFAMFGVNDRSVSLVEQALHALLRLSSGHIVRNPDSKAGFMLWDGILNGPFHLPQHARHLPAVITALLYFLNAEEYALQYSALHGLAHLKSPESDNVIRAYLLATSDPDLRSYADAALQHSVI